MFRVKREVGLSNRGSIFTNKKVLTCARGTVTEWTLRNSRVEFFFETDYSTGVRLQSLNRINGKSWDLNLRTLWSINVIKDVELSPHNTNYIDRTTYSIYPTHQAFEAPSVVPTVATNGTKSFTFIWRNVKYNTFDTSKTCNIYLTASLKANGDYLDLSLKLQTNHFIGVPTSTDVCISTVSFPKFNFRKTGDDEYDKESIFSVPLGYGVTYKWPNRYLRYPRFNGEAFQYSSQATRTATNGQPVGYYPQISPTLQRWNYASPGWMSIPCIIWGNTADQEGILIYAHDPDGCHAKGWQWSSDDRNVIVRIYDVSDHEITPYGIGGKHRLDKDSSYYGNQENEIGWSLRLRPFISPTRWVSWYGFSLYKEEEVPELEEEWQSKSFYQQYLDGDLEIQDTEVPFIFTAYGYTSLSGTTALGYISGAQFWSDRYRASTNPTKSFTPRFVAFSYLNGLILTGTDPTNVKDNVLGWEPWANLPTGQSVGITGFKSPDLIGANPTYQNIFSGIFDLGLVNMTYLIFPYSISPHSELIQAISGMDLCSKHIKGASRLLTDSTWSGFALRTDGETVPFPSTYIACAGLTGDILYNQFLSIASGMASQGFAGYHDTHGIASTRGCLAEQHKYRISGTEIIDIHPRSSFSHYLNKKHKDWISGYSEILIKEFNKRAGTASDGKWPLLAQGAEYTSDLNLAYVPGALYYDVQQPIFNAFFNIHPLLTGTLGPTRDDVFYQPDGGGALNSVFINYPAWLERCPAWPIIYGDRSIITTWSAPHMATAYDVLSGTQFFLGEVSGINPVTNDSDVYTPTHEHRVMDIAAHLALDFPYHRRITIGHIITDYTHLMSGDFGPFYLFGVSGEDWNYFVSGTAWSGLLEYIQYHVRLLGYEPNYMYHGNLEHPLDSFSISQSLSHSTPRLIRNARCPSTGKVDETPFGDDKIVHSVIRNVENNSLLLTLDNWFSGTTTFTGVFDPATYEIDKSYQVYSLEVVDNNEHGTKTLVATRASEQTYTIEASLPSMSMAVLEFVPTTRIADLDYYADLATSFLHVRYSYTVEDLQTNSVGFAYSYGTTVFESPDAALIGYKAPMTQQIANNLPQWMELRKNTSSRGWNLINSWGANLEEVLQNTLENSLDMHLITTNIRQRHEIFRVDIDSKEILQATQKLNLLFNSAFTIRDVSRNRLPAGWTDYEKSNNTNYTNLSKFSLVTSNSLELYNSIGIGQVIEYNEDFISSLVASIYLYADQPSTSLKMIVSIECSDGTIKNYTASVSTRSIEWRRLVLPMLDINSKVSRIKFLIRSESIGPVYVSAPQIEVGSSVSKWTSSPSDVINYLSSTTRFNIVKVLNIIDNTSIPLFGLSSERQFLSTQIPTRIEKSSTPLKSLDAYASFTVGRKVDYHNQIYDVNWTINSNRIIERSAGPSQFDVFNIYTLRDLRYHNTNLYGTREENVTRTLLVSAVRENLLYVVCKEEYKGHTYHILKIIRPKTVANNATYLESIIDFDLDINLSAVYDVNQIEESISSIGFSDKETSYMIVNTSAGRRLFYKLYFDYYYFSPSNNQLYTLENYNGSKIQVL